MRPHTDTSLLVTAREAAKLLCVCEKTLYTLTRRGEIPAIRLGRAVRYSRADLERFIARRRVGGGR